MQAKKTKDWKAHYEACRVSGLTRQAYCQHGGLSFKTYERQVTRLRNKDQIANALAPKQTPSAALTLLPVRIKSPERSQVHPALILRQADWELSLPDTVEPAWLGELLRRL